MNSIYLLIPLSVVLIGVGIWAFFWAVNSGQFDDLDQPGREILDDGAETDAKTDEDPPPPMPR
jgi:cbb3-type cytochrome oxidase maturation protein